MSSAESSSAGSRTGLDLPEAARPYVRTAIGAGALVVVAAIVLLPPPSFAGVTPVALIVVGGLSVLAMSFEFRLRTASVTQSFRMEEAAVAGVLLVLGPAVAYPVLLVSTVLEQIVQRRDLGKALYNVAVFGATMAVPTGLAYAVGLPPAELAMDPLGVGTVALGVAVMSTINVFTISGLIARLERRSMREIVSTMGSLTAVIALGNLGIGLIVGVLWHVRPWLIVLGLLPLAALRLSQQSDIQRRSDIVLMASERDRLDRVVAGATDGIVLLDRDARVEVWSPAMEEMVGVDARHALGQRLGELIHASTPGGELVDPAALLRGANPDDPTQVEELAIAGPAGRIRVVEARHSLLFGAYKRLVGDVVLFRDVTRQREIEAIKEDLVARVSHELRTPLTTIVGYSQIMRRRWDDLPDPERLRFIEVIDRQSSSLSRMVASLLTVHRATEQGMVAEPERVAVDPLVRTVVEDLMLDAQIDVPETLEAWCDREHLRQIVTNYLVNAARYGQPPIVVAGSTDGSEVIVRVRDHGDGVPQDFVPDLFEKFTQSSTGDTRQAVGLGLGLNVVRSFADANDGRVWYEPAEPVGACFAVAVRAADGA